MGRFHERDEHGEHEGYVVGYVPCDWVPTAAATAIGSSRPVAVLDKRYGTGGVLRELGLLAADRDHEVHGICVVGYACSCGWRSPYREQLPPVEWSPNVVHWSEWIEDLLAKKWWVPHIHAEQRRAEQLNRGHSTSDSVYVAVDLPRRVAVDLLALLNAFGNSDLKRLGLGSEREESANLGLCELGEELARLLQEQQVPP